MTNETKRVEDPYKIKYDAFLERLEQLPAVEWPSLESVDPGPAVVEALSKHFSALEALGKDMLDFQGEIFRAQQIDRNASADSDRSLRNLLGRLQQLFGKTKKQLEPLLKLRENQSEAKSVLPASALADEAEAWMSDIQSLLDQIKKQLMSPLPSRGGDEAEVSLIPRQAVRTKAADTFATPGISALIGSFVGAGQGNPLALLSKSISARHEKEVWRQRREEDLGTGLVTEPPETDKDAYQRHFTATALLQAVPLRNLQELIAHIKGHQEYHPHAIINQADFSRIVSSLDFSVEVYEAVLDISLSKRVNGSRHIDHFVKKLFLDNIKFENLPELLNLFKLFARLKERKKAEEDAEEYIDRTLRAVIDEYFGFLAGVPRGSTNDASTVTGLLETINLSPALTDYVIRKLLNDEGWLLSVTALNLAAIFKVLKKRPDCIEYIAQRIFKGDIIFGHGRSPDARFFAAFSSPEVLESLKENRNYARLFVQTFFENRSFNSTIFTMPHFLNILEALKEDSVCTDLLIEKVAGDPACFYSMTAPNELSSIETNDSLDLFIEKISGKADCLNRLIMTASTYDRLMTNDSLFMRIFPSSDSLLRATQRYQEGIENLEEENGKDMDQRIFAGESEDESLKNQVDGREERIAGLLSIIDSLRNRQEDLMARHPEYRQVAESKPQIGCPAAGSTPFDGPNGMGVESLSAGPGPSMMAERLTLGSSAAAYGDHNVFRATASSPSTAPESAPSTPLEPEFSTTPEFSGPSPQE